MKIRLKHAWFTPAGYRLRPQDSRAEDGSFEVPDEWRDRLPPTAKMVEDNFVAPVAEPEEEPQEPQEDPADALARQLDKETKAATSGEDEAREAHNQAAARVETRRRAAKK